MAHEFVKIGDSYVNLAHVDHVCFDGVGGAKVYCSGGHVSEFTGEDADAVAKAVGRYDARHHTAKEAKAEEKAAEPDPEPKKHK